MKHLHQKLFLIADRLEELSHEEKAVLEELDMHRSIDGDAQRDAEVGNYIDKEEAGLTRRDVARFEKALGTLRRRRAKLESTRRRLLAKLDK